MLVHRPLALVWLHNVFAVTFAACVKAPIILITSRTTNHCGEYELGATVTPERGSHRAGTHVPTLRLALGHTVMKHTRVVGVDSIAGC
jgi:hypothetical protein